MPHPQHEATEAYRSLCATHSVPVFHQSWWLDTVCGQWTGVTATGPDGACAIWPVPLERKLGVQMSRSPFLTPYLGPVVVAGGEDIYSTTPAQHTQLLQRLLQALPNIPVWHTAAAPYDWDGSTFQAAGFAVGQRPTYILHLTGRTEETLFAALHSQIRRAVRRVAETAVITNEPECASAMYELQRTTHHRKGAQLYHTAQAFGRIVNEVHKRGCGALWVARRNGVITGAQWSVWDARRCYNIGLARSEKEEGKFVAAALLWHAIRHAHSLGLEAFDFEGSSIPSIAGFFARFGGTVQPYLTLRKTDSRLWRIVQRIRA